MRRVIYFSIQIFLIISLGFPQEKQDKLFTLESAISMAIARNPIIKAEEYEVQGANLDIRKALIKKYVPTINFDAEFGVVPGAKGDIFFSPDKQTDLDDLGPFYKFDLSFVLPLYTFGGISSVVEAARQNLSIKESKKNLTAADLSLQVVRAYWGLSSAEKTESLAKSSLESFEQLLSEIQKRLQDKDSEVDDSDLLEAKTYRIDIEKIRQESIQNKDLAAKAFNVLLDLNLDEHVSTASETSPEFVLDENTQHQFTRLASEQRPEIRGLQSAINAIQAKINLTESQRLPVFYIGAGFSYAYAGNRYDQTNPFVVDNFNYRNIGFLFGLKWNPNIFFHNAEIQKNRYQHQAALEKMRLLKAKIGLEVSQAFIEARKNDALLKAAIESLKAAKTWLQISLDNWEMGIGDSYRLLRAYQAYFRLRGEEIKREYEFNVSLAKLSYILGDMDLYLNWVKDGKTNLD
jgi:outer membrane protein TolC